MSEAVQHIETLEATGTLVENVLVCVNELVVGTKVDFPMYDSNGVLLLAPGSTITDRFKDLLRRRGQDEVHVHKEQAHHLTQSGNAALAQATDSTDQPQFGEELTSYLDKLIHSGVMFVKNSGPAVRDELLPHGRKSYSPQLRQQLIQKNEEAGNALEQMMLNVLEDGEEDADQVMKTASNYLKVFKTDMDLMMSVATKASNDTNIAVHCQKMAIIAMAIGIELGLDSRNTTLLGACGLVHDWGMLKVPEYIRHKTTFPKPYELSEIAKHPIYSVEMLNRVHGFPRIIPLVCYQVHEKLDGSGYPRGTSGAGIHQFARILAVADLYATLTSVQSYRPPIMANDVMDCLVFLTSDGKLDQECVQKLIVLLSKYPIGSLMQLSDGSIAQTVRRNGMKYSEPLVRILRDSHGNVIDPNEVAPLVDISESELRIEKPLPFPGSNEIRMSSEIYDQCCR